MEFLNKIKRTRNEMTTYVVFQGMLKKKNYLKIIREDFSKRSFLFYLSDNVIDVFSIRGRNKIKYNRQWRSDIP